MAKKFYSSGEEDPLPFVVIAFLVICASIAVGVVDFFFWLGRLFGRLGALVRQVKS